MRVGHAHVVNEQYALPMPSVAPLTTDQSPYFLRRLGASTVRVAKVSRWRHSVRASEPTVTMPTAAKAISILRAVPSIAESDSRGRAIARGVHGRTARSS